MDHGEKANLDPLAYKPVRLGPDSVWNSCYRDRDGSEDGSAAYIPVYNHSGPDDASAFRAQVYSATLSLTPVGSFIVGEDEEDDYDALPASSTPDLSSDPFPVYASSEHDSSTTDISPESQDMYIDAQDGDSSDSEDEIDSETDVDEEEDRLDFNPTSNLFAAQLDELLLRVLERSPCRRVMGRDESCASVQSSGDNSPRPVLASDHLRLTQYIKLDVNKESPENQVHHSSGSIPAGPSQGLDNYSLSTISLLPPAQASHDSAVDTGTSTQSDRLTPYLCKSDTIPVMTSIAPASHRHTAVDCSELGGNLGHDNSSGNTDTNTDTESLYTPAFCRPPFSTAAGGHVTISHGILPLERLGLRTEVTERHIATQDICKLSNKRHHSLPNTTTTTSTTESRYFLPVQPPAKKVKVRHSARLSDRSREFANRTATLRRALSLISDASGIDSKDNTPSAIVAKPNLSSHPSRGKHEEEPANHLKDFDVPTVPASPAELRSTARNLHLHALSRTRPRREDQGYLTRVMSRPVPVIAPPDNLIARLSLSEEALAKVRLERLLEREGAWRDKEALRIYMGTHYALGDSEGESEVDGSETAYSDSDDTDHAQTIDRDDRHPAQRRIWQKLIGLEDGIRRKVIEWILEVLPDLPDDKSSTDTSLSPSVQTSSSGDDDSDDSESELYDQLTTSPETRFHAAYMFIRYYYLIMSGPHAGAESSHIGNSSGGFSSSGMWLMTWDIAVSCLAISVKFHRDFLAPLNPVYASEFQAIAPHCSLAYEDLEASHRDILSAFSYGLGDTPQSIIDEMWSALPSLRELLDFNGGWNTTRKETWWRLFAALLEPDVLRFPLSHLTAAALANGVVATLVCKYENEAEWRRETAQLRRRRITLQGADHGKRTRYNDDRRKRERRVERAAEGVLLDVQALLCISSVQMNDCRRWLMHAYSTRWDT